MKFLYLKLGRGNCLAEYWLQQGKTPIKNVFGKPAIAIFFGKTTTEECRKLITIQSKEELDSLRKSIGHKIPSYIDIHYQIRPFIEAGDNRKAKFVTIVHGLESHVYIYEPDSQVFDMPKQKYDEYDSHLSKLGIEVKKKTIDEHFPKIMFVKNVGQFTEFPHVLASLPCNQYFTRGTCREIDPARYWGVIQAIKQRLGEPIDRPQNDEQLLGLLGWHQLETLMFLILINAGVHPSAWRGGTLPEVDIVATNFTNSTIKIGTNPEISFRPMEKKTFQVKRGIVRKPVPNADYTVAIDFHGKENKRILTAKWLRNQIETQPNTRDWLEKSLHWTSGII
jgi:hypothetical protein